MGVMLVSALRCQALKNRAFLFQFRNQRMTLENGKCTGSGKQRRTRWRSA